MAKRIDVPSFGLLSGMKVAHASMSVAGPYCAQLFAEMGADVIWIENAKAPDIARDRDGKGSTIDIDRRNTRTIALDISNEDGQMVFARILKDVDIFIEASKPGMYDKFGFSDDRMWEINPKLVIVHISGFGQKSTPAYAGRASYDPIAQAFGGLMGINGESDIPPFPSNNLVADYATGYHAAFAALAAYQKAQATGVGESIDAAQYEIVMRMLGTWAMDAWNKGKQPTRTLVGPSAAAAAGFGSHMCADGNYVYIVPLGPGCMKGTAKVVGLEYGGDVVPKGSFMVVRGTPAGTTFDEAIDAFCMAHTAAEVETEMCASGVPCSQVMQFKDMPDNEQVQYRQSIIPGKNSFGDDILTMNVFPTLANNPGQIWRYGPQFGEDTNDILEELGFSASEIEALKTSKTVIGR